MRNTTFANLLSEGRTSTTHVIRIMSRAHTPARLNLCFLFFFHTGQAARVPSLSSSERVNVPVGHWRDSIWDIFRLGYCHSSMWTSCCCTLVGAGQVATRLHLTYRGEPGRPSVTSLAFRKLVSIVLSFWVTRLIMLMIITVLDPNVDSLEWVEPPTSYYVFCAIDDLLAYIYLGFTVLVLRNLRSHVRSAYAIPEEGYCVGGCEDTCCSLTCPCLVIGQLLRHTADYESYGARGCSATGLVGHAPSIV
jgi:Cys-rich protein (TIGR01571 family)